MSERCVLNSCIPFGPAPFAEKTTRLRLILALLPSALTSVDIGIVYAFKEDIRSGHTVRCSARDATETAVNRCDWSAHTAHGRLRPCDIPWSWEESVTC